MKKQKMNIIGNAPPLVSTYIHENRYHVTISDIEWDIGKNPVEDGYDLNYIKTLPKETSGYVSANSEETALFYFLDEISDDFGFLIQGCRSSIKKV